MEKELQSSWPPCISRLDYFKEFLRRINGKWPQDFDQDLIRKWDRRVWHKMGVEASTTIRTGWWPQGLSLTSAWGTEGTKGEGKRGKERFKNGKAELVLPSGPEMRAPTPDRAQSPLLGSRSWARCSAPASAVPGFQQSNSKAPNFKGNEWGQCQESSKDSSLNPSCS